jgi:hypothetical protein
MSGTGRPRRVSEEPWFRWGCAVPLVGCLLVVLVFVTTVLTTVLLSVIVRGFITKGTVFAGIVFGLVVLGGTAGLMYAAYRERGRPSPSRAGRALNTLIAILRLTPTASYALAQIIVVGVWAYSVKYYPYGVNPYVANPEYGPGLLEPFLAVAKLIGLTALLIVPVGALLGAFDSAARRSSDQLVQVPLLIVDALLIVLFALVWISFVEATWLYDETCSSDYYCPENFTSWPEYIGGLIGAELGLAVLVVVSVTRNRVLRREARRFGS